MHPTADGLLPIVHNGGIASPNTLAAPVFWGHCIVTNTSGNGSISSPSTNPNVNTTVEGDGSAVTSRDS
jgi:hypothetical protein